MIVPRGLIFLLAMDVGKKIDEEFIIGGNFREVKHMLL